MERLVEQIHACLVEALRKQRPQPFERPVTVAEIYQDLVPYRTVRARMGFEMNADYEHTLLRLLSGEGELARLDPDHARNELMKELSSANPNVGLFRKFAACDVWITPLAGGADPEETLATAEGPAAVQEEDVDAVFDAWESRSELWRNAGEPVSEGMGLPADFPEEDALELLLEEEVDPAAPSVEPTAIVEPAAPQPEPEEKRVETMKSTTEPARRAAEGSSCAFCDAALPAGRHVRFCPFCGKDQSLVPCASCGEALDRSWLFCVACGTAAGAHAPA
jgi:hypothetical protein